MEYIAALETANYALRLEAETAAERAQFQLAEVEHRLKNTFATILALTKQTARRDDTGEVFREAFIARLAALARSHDLMGRSYPDGAPLADIVERCLRPYDEALGRTILAGPVVYLPAHDISALGLAFHELATNATKHGALSVPQGRVEVTWRVELETQGRRRSLAITWRERGGPMVKAPERRGFGLRFLERGLGQGANGTTQLDFASHGVDCRIWLPLPSVYGEA